MQLLDSGVLTIRCDVAPEVTRWPVACSFMTRVQPRDRARVVAGLRSLRELRLCMSTTGRADLLFTVFTSGVKELARFESALGDRLPEVHVLETVAHLRARKRMGWLLDDVGRATDELVVPGVFPSERCRKTCASAALRLTGRGQAGTTMASGSRPVWVQPTSTLG